MAFLDLHFYSEVLGMNVPLHVVLPRKMGDCDDDGCTAVPTLYLLHGLTDDHSTWMRRTSIERYAEERGVAVVMPTTERGWYTDMAVGFRYRTFVGEELPAVCRTLFPRLSPRREDTWVAGNSMGGYGSLMLALTYPGTFSIAAPLSGAFDPYYVYQKDDPEAADIFGSSDAFFGSVNDPYHAAAVYKESGKPLPKIFMWCGSEDFLIDPNHKMRDTLSSLGYDLTYTETPGSHSWCYWDREIQNALDFMFEKREEL